MKLLVTGGCGFLGSNLAAAGLERRLIQRLVEFISIYNLLPAPSG